MMTPETITRTETRGSARLWFGMLAGPIAWAIQLAADWFLTEVVACAPQAVSPGDIGPVPVHLVIATLNGVLLLTSALAGWVSWREVRKLRGHDGTEGHRALWMARSGVINSVVFAVIILASYISIALTNGCLQ